MKVQFDPEYSAATIQAGLIRRLLDEVKPPDLRGTLTVVQFFRDYPVTLRLRAEGAATVAVANLPHGEYFDSQAETHLRQRLAELFSAVTHDVAQSEQV
jgi:hypothetical protein